MLTQCTDLIVPYLRLLYWATFKLGVYPNSWRDSTTVVLRKLGKPDYLLPNVHWPVALLNTICKVLSACIAEDLTNVVEEHRLISSNHSGTDPAETQWTHCTM